MKKRIAASLLTICLLIGMTPLFASAAESITMPKDLSDFLVAYEFGGQKEFDFRAPADNADRGGIMSSIVGHPTCVNYSIYPFKGPDTFWNGSDLHQGTDRDLPLAECRVAADRPFFRVQRCVLFFVLCGAGVLGSKQRGY